MLSALSMVDLWGVKTPLIIKMENKIYLEEEWKVEKDDNKITIKLKESHNNSIKKVIKLMEGKNEY